MKNYLKIFIIIISLSVFFTIGISKVNALDIEGNSGRLYKNLNSEKVVIYVGTGTHTLQNATYNEYRVSYYNNNFIGFYIPIQSEYNAFIYPYTNVSELSQNSTNYSFTRYNIANSSFSSYSSASSVHYLNVGIGYGDDFLNGTKDIYDYIDYSYSDIVDGNNNILYCGNVDTNCVSLFNITYEQGEVLMANYENASANLVSQYIETDLNPQDYTFSYYYNTGNGLENIIYEPICSETLVDDHIHYSCYYNIPLFYNTILTFNIDDKFTSNSVYSFIFNAYLSVLPDSNYYNNYRFTGYKFANISGIDTGTFGLSQYTYTSILHDNKTEIDYDIYVYDSSTGTKEDFITSPYYVSTNIDNNIVYRTFDFNGNSNLYLTIVLNDYIKYIDFDSDIFLFSPNTAYTHLSTPVECYNTEDISTCEHLATLPENQQSYKDSNNNTVNESNPINYYDSQDDFFNQLDSLFGTNQSFKGLTGIISSPLNLIRNLTTSSTCTDINLPIPYINKYITLPCMSSIYSTYFGDFFTLYQSVTFAIIGYFVIIKFIATIKDLYNPDNDKIEVVDL